MSGARQTPSRPDSRGRTSADIAAVIQKTSRRVIRTLRRLGYLETGIDAAVATGSDPLMSDEPALARTTAASGQQHMAFGGGPASRCDVLDRALGMQGNIPH